MLRITAMMTSLFLTLAPPGMAQGKTDPGTAAAEILTSLISRGYAIVEDERTWLGRQRIIAIKDGMRRELVFHPGTGEILRDYSVRLDTAGRKRLALQGERSETANLSRGAAPSDPPASALETAPGLSLGDPLGVAVSPEANEALE
ncbi:hypothetical protein [Tabrizicola sp.]|uniref:hypothetical protein n=1 Tax=Tabrizicola sp. TaxID=2005166 RepID=UPI003D2BE38A